MGVLREDKSSEGRWGPVQGLQWSPSPSASPQGTSTNLQTFPLSQAIIQTAQSLIFSSCLCPWAYSVCSNAVTGRWFPSKAGSTGAVDRAPMAQ